MLAKFNKPLWGALAIFVLALVARIIKANFFPFWHDEIIGLNNANSFAEALKFARVDHQPPLLYVIVAATKLLGTSPLILRLPHILASGLAVGLGYLMLVFYQTKRPFWLALFLVFAYPLVYYSQELRFYSLIFLLSLVGFWAGFELVLGQKFRPWTALVLAIALSLLSLLHYFSYTYMAALFVTLVLLWLAERKWASWQRLVYLAASYFVVFIANLAWLDEILDNFQANAKGVARYHVDLNLIIKLGYKIAGGGSLWTTFVVFVLAGLVIFWFYRWLIQKKGLPYLSTKIAWAAKDRLVGFLLVYMVVFLALFWGFSAERIIFHRYLLFLFWPFAFILLMGFDLLWTSAKKTLRVGAVLLFVALLGSNLLLLRAYWSSAYRVEDFRTAAQVVDELTNRERKTKVYLNDADPRSTLSDFRFYLKTYKGEFAPGGDELKKSGAKEFFKDSIFVNFDTFPPRPEDPYWDNLLAETFAHQKILWEDGGVAYLANRNQHPFLQEGTPFITRPGQYRRLVVYW